MVKRSMKGKVRELRDVEYDARQLKLKEDKKKGLLEKRGPSVKEFKRYKRKHKPAWKKAAPAAEGEGGSKVDLDNDEGEGDEEDEMERRIKRIKKQLDEVKHHDRTLKAAKEEAPVAVVGQAKKTTPAAPAKEKGPWKELLQATVDELEDGDVKTQLTRLGGFDNVPLKLKPKRFRNFVRESLALFGDENATLIEQMWEIFETVVRECKLGQ